MAEYPKSWSDDIEEFEMIADNWDQIQESFKSKSEDERNEMIDILNSAVDVFGLGDLLFGDYAVDEFKSFIDRQDET